METISISKEEYSSLIKENKLLKQQELLKKMNQLVDLMYESKYGLYMGNYTQDLTEYSINNVDEWEKSSGEWDAV